MDKNPTLKLLLETMLNNKVLLDWNISHGKSGICSFKIRFQADQDILQSDGSINSSAYFKRKTPSQLNRDLNRVKNIYKLSISIT